MFKDWLDILYQKWSNNKYCTIAAIIFFPCRLITYQPIQSNREKRYQSLNRLSRIVISIYSVAVSSQLNLKVIHKTDAKLYTQYKIIFVFKYKRFTNADDQSRFRVKRNWSFHLVYYFEVLKLKFYEPQSEWVITICTRHE